VLWLDVDKERGAKLSAGRIWLTSFGGGPAAAAELRLRWAPKRGSG
jgi:hypothetical protein